jgi:hypothetical protein
MFDGFSCSRARYVARRRVGVRPCWCGRHSDWRHQGRGTRRSDLLGRSLVCSRKSLSAAPMKMRQGSCHARRSCATGPSESAVVQAASRAAASLATYRARRSSGTRMSRTPPALRPRPRRPWLVPPQAHALAGRFPREQVSHTERLPDHSEASSGSFDQPGSADGTTSLEVFGRPNRQYTIDGRNTAEGSL